MEIIDRISLIDLQTTGSDSGSRSQTGRQIPAYFKPQAPPGVLKPPPLAVDRLLCSHGFYLLSLIFNVKVLLGT